MDTEMLDGGGDPYRKPFDRQRTVEMELFREDGEEVVEIGGKNRQRLAQNACNVGGLEPLDDQLVLIDQAIQRGGEAFLVGDVVLEERVFKHFQCGKDGEDFC